MNKIISQFMAGEKSLGYVAEHERHTSGGNNYLYRF